MIEQEVALRVAAVGDLHISDTSEWTLSTRIAENVIFSMAERADALFFVGDMIDTGRVSEAEFFSSLVKEAGKPTYAVLGNHEVLREAAEVEDVIQTFEEAGVTLLRAQKASVSHNDLELSVVGIKGGYDGTLASYVLPKRKKFSDRGRELLKTELIRSEELMKELHQSTVFLCHYPPILETVLGEDERRHDLHGSAEIGRVADIGKEYVELFLHGHTHLGGYKGVTEQDIPVYNVALPVLARTVGISKDEVQYVAPVFVAEFSRDGKLLHADLSS